MFPTVLAFGIAQIIGWGFTFNLPGVLGQSVADGLDTSLEIVLLGPTVMLTVVACISWWLAPQFDRYGSRKVMIVGAATIAFGLLLMSTAPNVPTYLLAWLAVGIGGAGSLSTATQIALADLFQDRARQAIGAMSLVSGLSNTVLWPVLSQADIAFGWRRTVMFGVGAILFVYIPLVYKFSTEPSSGNKRAQARPDSHSDGLDTPRFLLVAGVTALNGFITWGFSLTLIPLLTQKGVDHERAVVLASLLGLVSIAARAIDIVSGWSPLQSAIASTGAMFASFVLLYLGISIVIAAGFVVLYGIAGGMMSVVRATLPLSLFPPGAYASAAMRLALPLNLSFAVAPPVFGRALEDFGPNTALTLSLALSAAATACLAALILRVRRQDGAAFS